jgi:ribonucleotide monophosphatase NagD (HAD superfamily)
VKIIGLVRRTLASVGEPADACPYAGDIPEADIAGAHAAGMDALLVLTSVAASTAESVDPPEHVLASVADLGDPIDKSRLPTS